MWFPICILVVSLIFLFRLVPLRFRSQKFSNLLNDSITSLHSALEDLELLKKIPALASNDSFRILLQRLRYLNAFLLCARKLGNDVHLRSDDNHLRGSLGSLLVRIEDAVWRYARQIHSYRSSEDGIPLHVVNVISDGIKSFEKEIDEGYIILSEYMRQSSSPMTEEVMEGIDSLLVLLENLVNFFRFNLNTREIILDPIKAFREGIKFLRNFILFVTLQTVDHQQFEDLLIHIEAVVVNAAQLAHMFGLGTNDKQWCKGMECKVSELLQKIKPVNSQVYEIYTKALRSSKISRQTNDLNLEMSGNSLNIMEEFIDSLLCSLWEILQLEFCPVLSVRDQLQLLYEGLRVLRTILKEQPNKFDAKITELIGVVICDAGFIIFSLSQKHVKIDVELLDLLERINHIRAEVQYGVPKTSTFNFPRTNALGFINFLLETLKSLTSSKDDPNAQSRLLSIQEELVFLRSFLEDIVEVRNQQEELQALWNRVVQVAYSVEFLTDPLKVGDILDPFSISIDSITEEIKSIKADVLKIFHCKRQDIKGKNVARTSSPVPSQSIATITDHFVGFHDEATSIINRLRRGSKRLRIVAIVGMPGLGKTTLATKVYTDPSIMPHFHVSAWCSVSQLFDKKKVLLELLNHVVIKLPDKYFEMTEDDLAEELRRHLKRSRYLIFLDDLWDIDAWYRLEASFPDDSNGSRIILTSRHHDVAPQDVFDEKPHFLRVLTDVESCELLQKKLFQNGFCTPLNEVGKQIAENCNGLPLMITIVAGLLATMAQEDWKEVLESLSSGIISSTEQCMNTLELSYKHLPDYLKPCLLYFGAFPEDQLVSANKLIWLWIAEGFIPKTKLKNLEDVAREYISELIGRSLVMVVKERSIGGVKACRIHDLLHDFCSRKAKEENFFRLLKGYDELLAFNEPGYLRRLCIYSHPEYFKDSRLYCPHVRSLLFFNQESGPRPYQSLLNISFLIHTYKLLIVLDILQVDLGSVFPSDIEVLVHLKYLAVRGEMDAIPSSISNLLNLETIIVDTRRWISLPDTFWNLQKLRHLHIMYNYHSGFLLPLENLDNSSDLYELESFSGALIYQPIMEKQMRKFPNICKLKLKLLFDYGNNCSMIVIPDFLSRLESLDLSRPEQDVIRNHIEFDFCLPMHLKKLTLSCLSLPWSRISTIGQMPNLEVLKLLVNSFLGDTWNMEEGEFPKLRFLKLSFMDIVRWRASDAQFLCLEKLVLERCKLLEELPSCLENVPTLEMIEVSNCNNSTVNLVRQIEKGQMGMGNLALKILIRSSSDGHSKSSGGFNWKD